MEKLRVGEVLVPMASVSRRTEVLWKGQKEGEMKLQLQLVVREGYSSREALRSDSAVTLWWVGSVG